MTVIGRVNLRELVEKSGLGLEDMYMSRTDIWLCDGIDGHHYISDNEDTYETAWSYLDPQYGWTREELTEGEPIMEKNKRGICLKNLSDKYDIHDMEIIFLSDGKVQILVPYIAIIYSYREEELRYLKME